MTDQTDLRVLCCGDRAWKDPWIVRAILDGIHYRYGEKMKVIEGEASGADSDAKQWALNNGLTVENGRLLAFHAHWRHNCEGWTCPQDCPEVVGKPAGVIRNGKQLVEGKPHLCLAFHDHLDQSKGTRDMVMRCRKAKVTTYLFGRFDDPLRLFVPGTQEVIAIADDLPF